MNAATVVLGNGPIGAAVALLLAEQGRDVCLIGASYGQEGKVFSSHRDSSRIVRLHHADPFWSELTRKNLVLLQELEQACCSDVLRRTPVLYRACGEPNRSAWLLPRSEPARGITERFDTEDAHGGFLDPVSYVAAMNAAARRSGAAILSAVVSSVEQQDGHVALRGRDVELDAELVVDARGVFGSEPQSCDVEVWGKVCWFVERPLDDVAAPFCFIDAAPAEAGFRDVYGVVDYDTRTDRDGRRWALSKFGFTEREPQRLATLAAISAWFRGDYASYAWRAQARRWIEAFLTQELRLGELRPCAFGVTTDGRPRARRDGRLLRIGGCNGAAAKCCQALAEQVLAEQGLLS